MPQRVSFFNLAFLFPFGEIPTVLPMRLRFCRFIIIYLSIFYLFLLCSIICSCMLSTSFSFNFFFSCPCLLVKKLFPIYEICRYVGNIHPQVTNALLQEVFSSTGPLEGCKLIKKDKVFSVWQYWDLLPSFDCYERVL